MKKALLLLLLIGPIMTLNASGQAELRLYYSASLNGNLDGCLCKSGPRGGLVKRAHYLRSVDRTQSILVDAGDIFDIHHDILLAEAILQVYGDLGYDAVAVGDQEFSCGVGRFLEYGEGLPFLSNNLALCPDESRCILFSTGPLILERGDLTVGIFAILDPQVFQLYPEELTRALKLTAPETAAGNMLEILADRGANLNILLYHGPYESAVKLAEAFPALDVIVVGHEQRLIEAQHVGNAIIVSPGEEGNRLGILDLRLDNKGVAGYSNHFLLFDYEKDPDDPQVRELIEEYTAALRSKTGIP